MIWEIEDGRRVVEGLDEDGRPDPEYAAALGLRRAPAGRRAVASLIEFGIWALLQLPYWIVALPTLIKVATGALQPWGLASHPDLVWMIVATAISSVLTIAFVVVQLVLHGRKGVTLGKAIMGLRSVNVKTLARPGIGSAVVRGLVLWASFLVPVVGPALFLASPLLDREKRGRGWLDAAAGTWFVDVREGLDPYHEKRMRIARKTVAAEPEAERSQLPSLATPADSGAAAYRPGARISSGVVGAARPQATGAQQPVGLASQPAEPAPSHTVPGMPAGGARLGGYRPGELSGTARSDAASPSAPPAPLSGGIVDSVPGRAAAVPAPAAAPEAPGAQPTPDDAARWQPPHAPAQPSPSAPAAWAPPSPIADETVIEVEHEAPEAAPAVPAAPAAPAEAPAAGEIDDRAGSAAAAVEIDDRTVRRVEVVPDDDDLEATRARPSSRPTAAVLAFDSGERFAITGAALIGRNPSPSAGEVVDHLLPIADDTRSVSKTHLLIAVGPLAAIDRASTNGSSVVRGGAEHPLEPGRPFALVPGDVVRFGDRTVVVEAGA